MGKFNIRLIWEIRIFIFSLLPMFVKKHTFTPIRTFICFWLWIIENVSTQNTFDLSNQQISRKKMTPDESESWENVLIVCWRKIKCASCFYHLTVLVETSSTGNHFVAWYKFLHYHELQFTIIFRVVKMPEILFHIIHFDCIIW